MYIKVKFLQNGKPYGKERVYKTTFSVCVGQEVVLLGGGGGIVTKINIPEEEVEGFKDKIKEVESVVESK